MNVEMMYFKHRKLIHNIARRYAKGVGGIPSYSYEDIYQIATIGFIKACNEYKDEKGVPFHTYASSMMGWNINNELRSRRSVKFPQYFEYVWQTAFKHKLTNNEQDIHKLVNILGSYSYNQIENAMKWYSNNVTISLDKEVDDETVMYESIVGCEFDETEIIVSDFLETLTQKQRIVVKMLIDGMNQSEIAKELSVTQQQVSRIVKSIRKSWNDYKGE